MKSYKSFGAFGAKTIILARAVVGTSESLHVRVWCELMHFADMCVLGFW